MNLGESRGYPMFACFNKFKNDIALPDPRVLEIKMDVIQIDWHAENPFDYIVVKELELVPIKKETHPEQFKAWAEDSTWNTDALYGIKDPHEVTLINDYAAP